MKKIKIATWNVNSLRVRLSHLLDWLNAAQPDILALQEIKLTNEFFPLEEIKTAGYSAVFSGEKTYNGVAILSRQPIERDILTDFPDFSDPSRRLLGVTIGSIRILNVYVPNGQNLDSPKYQYKLNWLKTLKIHVQKELTLYPDLIVLGDFNIAPADVDVYKPERFKNKILFSEPEKTQFADLLTTGLYDSYRMLHPEGRDFTWWDYRLNAYQRRWGLRIDHILLSKNLLNSCVRALIDEKPRSLERPSDHAPVMIELRVNS